MSQIKVGTYAISNINPELNEITYYSYMIIDIVQNKSFNVITLENIFNISDILTIMQTKDGFFFKTQTDFKTLKFIEFIDDLFLENELFVNKGEVPEVLLDLVGKKYLGLNGEFTVGRKLIEGLKEYPFNHKLVRILIKYLPDEFLIDLYERFPFTDYDDFVREYVRKYCDDDYDEDYGYHFTMEYVEEFADLFDPNLDLMQLYTYEGRFEPYKKIFDNLPGDDGGHIQRDMFDDDNRNYNLGKELDYDVKKKFIIHSYDDWRRIPEFDPMDKDIIEILIEKDWWKEEHIYDVISLLFDGNHSDDVNLLENVHKYHNFFFRGMDSIEVNEIVDDILKEYKKNKISTSNRLQDEERDELIIEMINRLRYPVMTKSAAKT